MFSVSAMTKYYFFEVLETIIVICLSLMCTLPDNVPYIINLFQAQHLYLIAGDLNRRQYQVHANKIKYWETHAKVFILLS